MKDEKNMNTAIIIVLVLGLVLVTGLYAWNKMPGSINVAQQEQRETITVSETVEKEVMPDEVQIYVEMKTKGETAQEAKEENAEISEAVLAALETSGIEEDQTETTSYYLYEETKWDKDKEEYITTGYVLSHVIKVTTSEIDDAGEIIDAAVDAGATGVQNVQFTLSKAKESEIKGEVLAEAAEKAKDKAANIVGAIDVELGELVSISESNYYWPGPMYGYAEGAMMLKSEDSAETSISPQELTVTATVTLTYEIEQ